MPTFGWLLNSRLSRYFVYVNKKVGKIVRHARVPALQECEHMLFFGPAVCCLRLGRYSEHLMHQTANRDPRWKVLQVRRRPSG